MEIRLRNLKSLHKEGNFQGIMQRQVNTSRQRNQVQHTIVPISN